MMTLEKYDELEKCDEFGEEGEKCDEFEEEQKKYEETRLNIHKVGRKFCTLCCSSFIKEFSVALVGSV